MEAIGLVVELHEMHVSLRNVIVGLGGFPCPLAATLGTKLARRRVALTFARATSRRQVALTFALATTMMTRTGAGTFR